ncbi:MAG: hypothetical protein KA243_02825 [Candidatus Aminicenantes bacterium]|nr:hypothetical protein [Candidatus Aminicenantes bacterium]
MKRDRGLAETYRAYVHLLCALFLLLLTAGPVPSSEGPAGSMEYGVGNWDPESGLGNHRFVVRVEAPEAPGPAKTPKADLRLAKTAEPAPPAAAWVRIEWRRRDLEPEKKNVIVVDAASGERVTRVAPVRLDRESGEFVFEPPTVPGDYYFYYLPYKSEGRKNYPSVAYDPPAWSADPVLAARAAALASAGPDAVAREKKGLLRAEAVRYEAADAFAAFTPMERIATAAETRALLAAHPDAAYLVFPEDRTLAVRMTDDLPEKWAAAGPAGVFRGSAARGEYYTYQLGVWAARRAIADLDVRFSDLALSGNDTENGGAPVTVIPAKDMTCLNEGGVDWDGSPLVKAVPVGLGQVQALWCGAAVPVGARPGLYKGTATVAPSGLPECVVAVELEVTAEALADRGDADPSRMTRLRWLDSTLAQDDGVVPPYTPVEVEKFTVKCLGRSLAIGRDGFPARIRSFFAPEMTRLRKEPVDVLAAPMALRVVDGGGNELDWTPSVTGPRVSRRGPGAVAWEADNCNGDFLMRLEARMEFDGFVDCRVAVTARRDLDVADIRLEVPWSEAAATYMMGLGFKGGRRPDSFEWAWDPKKNQDALWLGAVHAGMQVGLRAENYSRPLNTNFYLSKPLHMPPSWWNEGRGTVTVRTADAGTAGNGPGARAVVLRAASGPRRVRTGETLHFDFTLLITPFKPIEPGRHFRERYFHAFEPLEKIAAAGANVVNVHHANAVNPYINYPFLRVPEMAAYVGEAHRRGMKVKIYNTVRELSNRAPELFALRSLGREIFTGGPGGGYSWLQEHLGGDYIAAWFVPELKDAAVINSGMSRWHNYYIEGLDWVARNIGIDGLYLDDVAFDRTTMKRVRKVLDRNRPGALIDLHSANQYNVRDGFASSANLYLEHFPYLNRLWFGEYFDYAASGPDYWLVETSGLPFGLMGEMLQDGGNPWRGMVFGMTARLPWAGDPRPLWKAWDEFGLAESEMVGWWVEKNPVRTGRDDVLATSYVRRGGGGAGGARNATMVAVASWADGPVDVRLTVDWKALGLDPKKVTLRAPAIDKFQDAAEFTPGEAIRIDPGQGLLLVLR